MMIPSTIYLVRHAESAVNARQGVPTQYDASGAPLTERGRQQARELALHFQDLPIAHVYSSNLLRAHQTALILANDRPLSTSSRLRERDRRNSASQQPETDAAMVARITSILNEIACHHAKDIAQALLPLIPRSAAVLARLEVGDIPIATVPIVTVPIATVLSQLSRLAAA